MTHLIISIVIVALVILYNVFLNPKDKSSGGGFFPNIDFENGLRTIASIIIGLVLLLITAYVF